ncbi:MAG: response regulator [Gammaproteobacteria bacterium]|nr:response regulator [Gammaproteobacteria bacterium]
MAVQISEVQQNTAIYVVESDPATRRKLNAALAGMRWPVYSYATPKTFLDSVPRAACGCVVANFQLVETAINDFLQSIEREQHQLAVILMCRHMEIPDAVAAMRAGVHDVMEFPVVERALRRRVRGAILNSQTNN